MAFDRTDNHSNIINTYVKINKRKIQCPSCKGVMRYKKRGKLWVCEKCGYRLQASDLENKYVFWFCDNCEAYLNEQDGFSSQSGTWKCTICGKNNDVSEDAIFDVCRDCGEKLPKGTKGNLCETCKRKRAQKLKKVLMWVGGAVLTVATLAALYLIASSQDEDDGLNSYDGLGDDGEEPDDEDKNEEKHIEDQTLGDDRKKWTSRLASINEAIYDTRKELTDADARVAVIEGELELAKEGTLFSQNCIPDIEGHLARAEESVRGLKQELERLESVLQEHYKNEPPIDR